MKRSCRGITFVEVAFIFPVVIAALFAAGYLYRYVRIYQVVRLASETGAAIASGAEVSQVYNPKNSYLGWTPASTLPVRPDTKVLIDQCRNSPDAATCVSDALTAGRGQGFLDLSPADPTPNPILSKQVDLPFKLYDTSATPGYFPVQALPIIGIERACFEPYNESGTTIPNSPSRFFNPTAAAGNCTHVRPMYWQSPQVADFDGDGREDIVFFRPTGTSTNYGADVALGESDFVVYLSGAGYSFANGVLFFNLTIDRALSTDPYAVPIVADYDRDGISDFAVFEPKTGKYRIAFSASRFRVFGEGTIASAVDATNNLGLVPIPGTFLSTKKMQIAIIQTATGTAANRFRLFVTDGFDIAASDLRTKAPGTVLTLTPTVTTYTSQTLRPHRGTISVPAFADYDDDGITEIGYLSWYGGNLTTQIGGKVIGASNTSVSEFETADAPAGGPLDVRMHPYSMTSDSYSNLYYLDSVDSRIWRIDNVAGGYFKNAAVKTVVTNHATLAARDSRTSISPLSNIFPDYNVSNIPFSETNTNDGLTAANTVTAGSVALEYPSKMVVGSDGVMYIADWGNARIIRIVDNGSNGIDASDTASLVLGMQDCASYVVFGSETCPTMTPRNDLPGSVSATAIVGVTSKPVGGDKRLWKLWPKALAIIPGSGGKYHLAFSSGNGIYMIENSGVSGGPTGAATDVIHHIAGTQTTVQVPSGPGATSYRFSSEINSSNPRVSRFCPIVDLEYTANGRLLYAASSCSAWRFPTGTPGAPALTWQTGGILLLVSAAADSPLFSSSSAATGISAAAGGFYSYPCTQSGVCVEPNGSGEGIYQRRPNYTVNSNIVDLINPVDMEIGPDDGVFVINQWRGDQISNATSFPNAPQKADALNMGQLLLFIGARIFPFNPSSSIDVTRQLGSPDWYSPWRLGASASVNKFVKAHESPIADIKLPATSSLKIIGNNLYVGSMWVRDPSTFAAGNPMKIPRGEMGTIFKVNLDMDGDGTANSTDTDVDGDGVADASDTGNQLYCQTINSTTSTNCRFQDRARIPRWYFQKLDGGDLQLWNDGSTTNDRTYAEFLMLNSVAECGDAAMCSDGTYSGGNAVSETWATLYDYGNDQDLTGGYPACDATSTADESSPYFNCKATSNGPIAIPQTLSSFVGSAVSGVKGAGFLRDTSSGTERLPSDRMMLFPAILSSTQPRENGIKPTRSVPVRQTKSPGIRNPGVLCQDAFSTGAMAAGPEDVADTAYSFNPSSSSALSLYSGFDATSDSTADNDAFGYSADCSGPADSMPDGREAAYSGIILQLDHDDINGKESGNGSGLNWPTSLVAGDLSKAENRRQFLMLDLDGDGRRNPTWLSSEVFPATGARNIKTGGIFTLISTALRGASSSTYDPQSVEIVKQMRKPFSTSGFFATLGWVNSGLMNMSFEPRTTDATNNFQFDLDDSVSPPYNLTAFIGLDFEAWIARTLQVSEKSDVGSGMYRNYISNNRFSSNVEDLSPALVGSRNVITASLRKPPESFVSNRSDLDYEKAFVGFLKKNTSTNVWEDCPDDAPRCEAVEVSYAIKFFGQKVVISNRAPISLGRLQTNVLGCDPNGGSAAFPCS